jgi:hypothetical protein
MVSITTLLVAIALGAATGFLIIRLCLALQSLHITKNKLRIIRQLLTRQNYIILTAREDDYATVDIVAEEKHKSYLDQVWRDDREASESVEQVKNFLRTL